MRDQDFEQKFDSTYLSQVAFNIILRYELVTHKRGIIRRSTMLLFLRKKCTHRSLRLELYKDILLQDASCLKDDTRP